MASLVLLVSSFLRPQNPTVALTKLPPSSLASSCAAAISSTARKTPANDTTGKYLAEIEAEDVQEPKFCLDLAWP
ncbi:hypothetical protein Tsubulata_010900 [Turnera subulata]|uniref:Uncharacterized protein n=1 Tax=Turnera subulata TaxID=218843 RepID=A0A9Q0FVW8_9ROSI|nr:hypothetical protein Tsubulata_010900 [Turnera subulata]